MSPVSATFSTFSKPVNTIVPASSTTSATPTESQKKDNYKSKIGLGIGLTCLAASGVYIATGHAQNVGKVFEKIKTADSMMNVLRDTKLSKKNFKELMFKITGEEEVAEKFISEVTSDPRKSKEHTKLLKKKIGGAEELLDWMIQPKGYQEAYYKHSHKIVKDAKKPDDLIGISPNWNIWVMKDKFGKDFSFGELPKEIENADKYREMFNASLKQPHIGAQHEGIIFEEYICGGLSGKAVRKIKIGEKNYILKFQNPSFTEDLADNIEMKSDSTFLNAQLERYLGLHDYKQGPKLKFYDYKTHSALYEMSEGTRPDKNGIKDIVKINKQLGDLNSLGVYYNDLNQGNFLEKNGVLTFIDSGESSYVDFFKPGVTALHFTLPNLNGRGVTDSAAAITLAK